MSLDHKIIWNELRVPDLESAFDFYGQLFGWTTKPEERETYVHFYKGEPTVAGVMVPHGGGAAVPSHWHVYVGTSDIESYVQRAKDAGGQILMPIVDIPHTGRMSTVADTGGAVLSPFQVANPERSSWGHNGAAGHFCWAELLCQKASAAKDFYGKVVGWQVHEAKMGETIYSMLIPPGGLPEQAQAGIMQMNKPDLPDTWLPYVSVASVDKTAALVLELGGTVCVQPTDLAKHGRIAVIIDPQGAVLGIYESLGSTC